MGQDSRVVMDREDELQQATERAERAEAEAARLREQMTSADPVGAAEDHPSGSEPSRHDAAKGASREPQGYSVKTSSAGTSSAETSEKEPPSPSSAGDASGVGGGEAELRKDPMMAHLLDSLAAAKDIGHYGRLVFAMVARHFLPHEEVVSRLTNDRDFTEEDAELMLRQTEGRDYSPPRRERILEWQAKQDFPILPNADDPDAGNLYRNLTFPQEVYRHIGHYQEEKKQSGE